MQRQLLIALGGGLASAVLSLGLLSGAGGFAMIAYFAPLPLFLVGLWAGVQPAVMAGALALAALGLLGGLSAAAVYLGSVLIPTWIVVYHALSQRMLANGSTGWYAPGEIVARLAALGAVFIAVITAAHMADEGGLMNSVRAFLQASIEPLMPADGAEQTELLLDSLVPLFPAFATLSWLAMLVVNATLAQALLVKWAKPVRPTPDYTAIAAPEWAYWAVVAAAALKLLSSGDLEYLAQNLVVIFATPFFFVGLAIVHALVRRLRFPGIGLTLFYVSLFLFSWFAAVVAALGFAEQWVQLRSRYGHMGRTAAPRNHSEDE